MLEYTVKGSVRKNVISLHYESVHFAFHIFVFFPLEAPGSSLAWRKWFPLTVYISNGSRVYCAFFTLLPSMYMTQWQIQHTLKHLMTHNFIKLISVTQVSA